MVAATLETSLRALMAANAQQERLRALEGSETPAVLESFFDQHASGLPAQLSLPLRGAASRHEHI